MTKPPEDIELVPFEEESIPEVNELYTRIAKQKYSLVYRTEDHWKKILKKALSKVIIKEKGKIVGYIFTRRKFFPSWEFPYNKGRISIVDWIAETPNAVAALFWYMRLFENTVTEVA